jgi:hypothetical protein
VSTTVLDELAGEEVISLAEAARRVPGTPCVQTLNGWVRRGLRLPSGRVVRLQAIRSGVRWLTTAQAVRRFLLALQGGGEDAACERAAAAKPDLVRG